MPFDSKAQQRFAYANPSKFGGKKGLKEWSAATDFSKLPEKANKPHMDHVMKGLSHRPKAAKKSEDKRKHGYHETTIKHHPDGSHTVMSHPIDGGEPIGGAASNLEGVQNMLQQHLGEGEPANEQE